MFRKSCFAFIAAIVLVASFGDITCAQESLTAPTKFDSGYRGLPERVGAEYQFFVSTGKYLPQDMNGLTALLATNDKSRGVGLPPRVAIVPAGQLTGGKVLLYPQPHSSGVYNPTLSVVLYSVESKGRRLVYRASWQLSKGSYPGMVLAYDTSERGAWLAVIGSTDGGIGSARTATGNLRIAGSTSVVEAGETELVNIQLLGRQGNEGNLVHFPIVLIDGQRIYQQYKDVGLDIQLPRTLFPSWSGLVTLCAMDEATGILDCLSGWAN